MFKTITSKIQRDQDYPERQFVVDVLTRVLEGTLYDHLEYGFHQEKKDSNEYIPLRDRRPSVKYALCRTVVDDSVSLLFSEGHFPAVDCKNEEMREAITALIKETKLNQVMIDAALKGSVGSVAIFMRVIKSRVFFEVKNTQFLTPKWRADAPDTLESVTEKYKVKGSQLRELGYDVPDDKLNTDYWFQRTWDDAAETWFVPWPVGDKTAPQTDAKKTTKHSLGFVPVEWVKNLSGGEGPDGGCTFADAIDTSIEIDYQLSQAGRGLKYSSDPTLLIKEPAVDNDGAMVKGGGNAIVVNADGDAKMLEIDGTAAQAVIEYVRVLRELALESIHGNRANADKVSAAQSGRAMELLNQNLIWLADKLRISYGEGALLSLLRKVVAVSAKFPLKVNGKDVEGMDANEPISLIWPAWFAPTQTDKQTQATTLKTLREAKVLSQETSVKTLAADYDIEDPADEIAKIATDEPIVGPVPPPAGKADD